MSGVAIGSEHDIHEWGKVCVISCKALFGVMPVMQLRRADQHPQGPQWKAHVGVNVDRPDPAKCCEACESRKIET